MERYDPHRAPDAHEWLAIDEGERILLAETYHRRAGVRLPNVKVHAVVHVIVENQIALGEEIPSRTLVRLMQEGLDRHEAVHAVGMVLMEYVSDVLSTHQRGESAVGQGPNQTYHSALERLTAESWRHSADDDE